MEKVRSFWLACSHTGIGRKQVTAATPLPTPDLCYGGYSGITSLPPNILVFPQDTSRKRILIKHRYHVFGIAVGLFLASLTHFLIILRKMLHQKESY